MEGCFLWAILKRVIMWCINCIIIASEQAREEKVSEVRAKYSSSTFYLHVQVLSFDSSTIMACASKFIKNTKNILWAHNFYHLADGERVKRKNVYLFCSTTGPSLSLFLFLLRSLDFNGARQHELYTHI